ncbi:PQQ-binding-like beta-propeller repeat protein [Flammeovirga sp. SJP92]|uniref:PQQ-binding-like beta-propeller repeat protein n=1 Tax=Flammeovirga sp. SJP92 TaxID=1775430 RepID=UPI0007894682|nr:PQQ-binding-like beta-propeller repeat protein [Flammeovirga sp. SJP92]KXX71913.1 hypothetical protein AVL50_03770 [Flammeovirga sp. SJP92]
MSKHTLSSTANKVLFLFICVFPLFASAQNLHKYNLKWGYEKFWATMGLLNTQKELPNAGSGFMINSAPVKGKNEIVFSVYYTGMYSVSLKTGELLWASSDHSLFTCGTSNQIIYFSAKKNAIISKNISDGKVNWEYKFEVKEEGAYVSANENIVVFATFDGKIYSLNSKTGKVNWIKDDKQQKIEGVYGFSGLTKSSITLCTWSQENGQNFILTNLDYDGNVKWSKTFKGWKKQEFGQIASKPLIENDIIYVSTGTNIMYAINITSGEIEWEYKIKDNQPIYCTPYKVGNRLYFNTRNDLFCYDVNKKELIWEETSGVQYDHYSSPIIIDDVVLYSSSRGLKTRNALTGEIIEGYLPPYLTLMTAAIKHKDLLILPSQEGLFIYKENTNQ